MRTIYIIMLFMVLFAGLFLFSYSLEANGLWLSMFLFLSGMVMVICSAGGILFLGNFCIKKYISQQTNAKIDES